MREGSESPNSASCMARSVLPDVRGPQQTATSHAPSRSSDRYLRCASLRGWTSAAGATARAERAAALAAREYGWAKATLVVGRGPGSCVRCFFRRGRRSSTSSAGSLFSSRARRPPPPPKGRRTAACSAPSPTSRTVCRAPSPTTVMIRFQCAAPPPSPPVSTEIQRLGGPAVCLGGPATTMLRLGGPAVCTGGPATTTALGWPSSMLGRPSHNDAALGWPSASGSIHN